LYFPFHALAMSFPNVLLSKFFRSFVLVKYSSLEMGINGLAHDGQLVLV
jgi:hypothetical protein